MQKGKLSKKNILISGEFIKKITSTVPKGKNINTFDAKGMIIIPGLIDSHVHMREPGSEYKEDFFSGSKAAVAGGVTTFLDMPNNKPPITTVEDLNRKRQLASKSVANYGFHFGTTGDNIDQIKEAWKSNIASVKIYMDETTGSMKITNEKLIKEVFANSRTVCVHAEGKNAEKAFEIAKATKTNLYFCHMSKKSEMDFIIKKKKPKNVFVEVTPHHLFLSEKNASNYNLMKPELKPESDVNALWDAIKKGIVDTIGTDHAPHTAPEKEFEEVFGVPGLETMLPLLLDAVNKKRITLEKVVKLTSENPARIFKIKKRGKIEPGYYADLTIIDMNLEKEVDAKKLFTKCGWSPFSGWKLKGWPVATIVNGHIVFKDGEINHVFGQEVEIGN